MNKEIDDFLIQGLVKDFPNGTLYEKVKEQSLLSPDSIAVQFEDKTLKYGELIDIADQIANQLINYTQKEQLLIGVFLDWSLELVPCMLAIIKVGCICVPIPTEYPEKRIEYIVNDCSLKFIFSNNPKINSIKGDFRVIDVREGTLLHNKSLTETLSPIIKNPIAFIMYTSGSSGNPKGVFITNQGICNRLYWMKDFYRFTEKDVVFHKSSIGFDVAIWEIFLPLFFGGKVIIIPPSKQKMLKYYIEAINYYGITFIQLVPSMLKLLLDHPKFTSCKSLRVIVCGGEKWGVELGKLCLQKLPHIELCNGYGPTEASLGVSGWRFHSNWTESYIPIGTPVHNVDFVVLDEKQCPVIEGETGELYIGGLAVSPGYFNNTDLTLNKFVKLPSLKHFSSNFYRTGDIVRKIGQDQIVYVGRKDNQVQIDGLRIELEEIENIIRQFDGINEVIVLCKEFDENKRMLFAILESTNPNKEELYNYCKNVLPLPMIPNKFIFIPKIPLSVNGKLDRNALSELID